MKRKLNAFLALFVLSFGAFIGYNSKAPGESLIASEQTMIRWVDVPKTGPLDLKINMREDSVLISGNTNNATVTVITEEKIKTVPKYIIKEVDKPIYIANSLTNKIIDKFCPLGKPVPPKINVDRN